MIHDLMKKDNGVSTVVASMLVLAIITTFVSALNAYYIPALGAKSEIEHMQEVHKSFNEIDSRIVLYSYLENKSGEYSQSYSPVSKISMPLGDNGIPLISSSTSSGTLITQPGKGWVNISMNYTLYTENNSSTIPLQVNKSTGYLKYISSNIYWLDQDLVFENGATILTQYDDSVIRSSPFEIDNDEQQLTLCAYNITGIKDTMSGNGDTNIGIQVKNSSDKLYTNVTSTNVTVFSKYPQTWEVYLSGITNSTSRDGNTITAEFNPDKVRIISSDVKISFSYTN